MAEMEWWTIRELVGKLRSGEVSSVEVTRHLLGRIEVLDPELHAYRLLLAERAVEKAREADARRSDGGPLEGVPFAIKDLIDLEGTETTAGGPWNPGKKSTSAPVARRLEEAGAILVGKLRLTEGAYGEHHPEVDPPRNPWNRDRWPGVSSSGSGVAAAAGLAYGTLGSDTGGSIRFPSAVNGVVGLKPTWGRVSRAGVFPLAASLDHVGPIVRSVADAALVLSVIAGPDPEDPTTLPHAWELPPLEPPKSLEGLRIGIDERWCHEGLDASIVDPILEQARRLAERGAVVRPVEFPDWTDLPETWIVVCGAEVALAHEGIYPEKKALYGAPLAAFLDNGRSFSGVDLARAHERRLRLAGALRKVWDEVDVLACPSLGIPVPPATQDEELDPMAVMELTRQLLRFTAPFDFTGSPTLSIPCGLTGDGMPLSLQLVAPDGEEARLVRAGLAYEEMRGPFPRPATLT